MERAILEEADYAFSWFNFGISAIAAGDFDGGIAALERMFSMPGPQRAFFPIGYVMLADAYAEGSHDVGKGMAIRDAGLEHTPGYPNIPFTRGFLLSRVARYA